MLIALPRRNSAKTAEAAVFVQESCIGEGLNELNHSLDAR